MNANYLFSLIIQLLFISNIKCYSFNEFYNDACSLIKLWGSIPNLLCSTGSITLKDGSNSKKLVHVPPLECKGMWIEDQALTEVCSSPPYQLYFDARGYEVLGCYNTGKPGVSTGSEPFVQCCQVRHSAQWNNGQKAYWWGNFCSGTRQNSNFKNPGEQKLPFNLDDSNSNKHPDPLLYYRAKRMNQECDKWGWKTQTCLNNEQILEKMYKLKPNWNKAKKF